jgi:hypothetical protein
MDAASPNAAPVKLVEGPGDAAAERRAVPPLEQSGRCGPRYPALEPDSELRHDAERLRHRNPIPTRGRESPVPELLDESGGGMIDAARSRFSEDDEALDGQASLLDVELVFDEAPPARLVPQRTDGSKSHPRAERLAARKVRLEKARGLAQIERPREVRNPRIPGDGRDVESAHAAASATTRFNTRPTAAVE